MKQFLAVAALDETAVKKNEMLKNSHIYTEGFTVLRHEHMEFSVLVDGELYNQRSLHEELQKAGFPKPAGLEETVLYAYLLWGEKAMLHMEGAYSFLIQAKDSLFCAKDPLGLRPIYYLLADDCIWISSRIQTLLDAAKRKAVLDRSGILELFAFGPSISEDRTLYKDVSALPMGYLLRVSNAELKIKQYYTLHALPHTDTLEETLDRVHELMCASIHAQADGAQASFLSGGLDSSLITSIAANANPSWRTYSLDYEGNKENFKGNMYQVSMDTAFIQDMCAYCHCSHTPLMITQQELCDLLEDAMAARETPGMADVDSSLLWLCQQVAEHEQVILSGECSDEIFGGYPWFYRDELKDLDTFPWLRSTKERISLLHPDLRELPFEDYIAKCYAQSVRNIEFLDTDTEEDRRARIHTILCLHWFMQTLVTRQVCMGDAASLNIRAPFANVKLLEYVYNIPWDMKFLQQEEKGILRKAFEQELPESVAHRKKNPFPKTHNPQYAELISKRLRERYDDPKSPLHQLFDDAMLRKLIDSKGESFQLPWYGQLMSGPQLLAYLYQIDRWIITKNITIEK
ncbi:MAG: asparagine synthetase B family protein [Clostridium sp.]